MSRCKIKSAFKRKRINVKLSIFFKPSHYSDKLRSVIPLKDHKHRIKHHSQNRRYNNSSRTAKKRDHGDRHQAEEHNYLMNYLRLTGCTDNFFNGLLIYIKRIGAVCWDMFFPNTYTQ